MKNLKYPIVALAFLLVLGAGLALQRVYVQHRVTGPLAKLTEILPQVESVDVVKEASGKQVVRVRFAEDAPLEEVYPQVETMAQAALGASMERIVIEDERNAVLSQAFYQIHFAIREGATTGKFTDMADVVDHTLRQHPISDHRVTVGDRHVFVALRADGGYLHAAVPRYDHHVS